MFHICLKISIIKKKISDILSIFYIFLFQILVTYFANFFHLFYVIVLDLPRVFSISVKFTSKISVKLPLCIFHNVNPYRKTYFSHEISKIFEEMSGIFYENFREIVKHL